MPLVRKSWNRNSQKFISIRQSSRHTRLLRLAVGNLLKKSDAYERRCLGRIRGGLTTKINAVTGECGKLVHFLLSAGQRGDAPQDERLLEKFKPGEVGVIVADTAYDSDSIRQHGRRLKAKVCIKPNPSRKAMKRYDQIERFFGRIKHCRRVAKRYEKKAINFAGFIWLAALVTDII